jgi:ligand-binding sensor domain-containing protein
LYDVTVPFQSAIARVFASGIRDRLPSWLCILALLLTVLSVPGQEPRNSPSLNGEPDNDYVVSFWRTTQGLPHNTVNALLQTRDGYLWVGTGSGLVRFDGLVFTPIGAEMGLGDVVVTALLEDQRGGLWVGTQGKGVFRLLKSSVQHYTGTEGLAGDAVTSLAEDTTGKVWIGTQNGLNYWVSGRLFRFQTSATRKDDSVVALQAGEAGALWVTTRSGVFRLQNGQAAPFRAEHLPQGRNAEFIGAYEDRAGNLWAFGATFLLNVTQGRSLNSFPSFSLTSSRVWTICEQGNGDFWIGTSGQGLFRFQNGRFEAVGGREGLEQCDIRALHADRWGNLWIGTGGNGLARLRTRRLRSVGLNEGLNSQRITAIASDLAGGLWVGSADTGLWHWNGTRAEQWSGGGLLSSAAQISSLCVDARTNLWVGTLGQGVVLLSGNRQRRFSTSDGLHDDQIRCVAVSRGGEGIWVGTQAGTLHLLRGNGVQTCDGSVLAGGLGAITALLPEHGETLLAGTEKTWHGWQPPQPCWAVRLTACLRTGVAACGFAAAARASSAARVIPGFR